MGKMIIIGHPEEAKIIKYWPFNFWEFTFDGKLVIEYNEISRITGGFCFYVAQPPVYVHMQLYDKDCKMLNYNKFYSGKEGDN